MIPFVILAIEDEDDRAFMTELYSRYERLIYSEIRKLVDEKWEAEDVMQTTLLKLIDRLDRLREMDERHRVNYIITAARNNAISLLRMNKSHLNVSLDETWDDRWDFSPELSVEEIILRDESIARLRDVWPQLDFRSRYLLEAKYLLGVRADEIARVLGIKEGSVRMELSRARRKVRQLLDDKIEDEDPEPVPR